MTSKCSKCKCVKDVSEFSKHSRVKSGIRSWCKECVRESNNSRTGLVLGIYTNQRHNSKSRGLPPPSYTLDELKNFVYSQDNFEELYNNWSSSGYIKLLVPSIDRINDYKPYSLDNIRLTTWEENRAKSHRDRKNGINNKFSKTIEQLTLSGELIKTYYSIGQAHRETKVNRSNIGTVCRGINNKAGGYKWRYALATQSDSKDKQ